MCVAYLMARFRRSKQEQFVNSDGSWFAFKLLPWNVQDEFAQITYAEGEHSVCATSAKCTYQLLPQLEDPKHLTLLSSVQGSPELHFRTRWRISDSLAEIQSHSPQGTL